MLIVHVRAGIVVVLMLINTCVLYMSDFDLSAKYCMQVMCI